MANIVINEVSQNYTYNIGSNSYAQVAMPITACWGPGFFDPDAYGIDKEDMLESTTWKSFPSTKDGMESFISTFRGPASNYRTFADYSYQMAMTLLAAGYDLLVCRICPGTPAQAVLNISEDASVIIKAKYPGTFGNSLQCVISKVKNPLMKHDYWNIIVYVVDTTGVKTAVENKVFVFDIENSSDRIPYVRELESDFIEFGGIVGDIDEQTIFSYRGVAVMLDGGMDIVPMVTSKEYDDAYAEQIRIANELVGLTATASHAEEEVENCNAHISKLAADLVNYQNKLEAANKVDPVDSELVAELEAKIQSVTTAKTQWEGALTEAQAAKTAADTALSTAKDSLKAQKEIVSAESVNFRRTMVDKAIDSAKIRYNVSDTATDISYHEYISALASIDIRQADNATCLKLMNQEWIFSSAMDVYDLLMDKLSYTPNRIISPGWDDQNISDITGLPVKRLDRISPIHEKLMYVGYYSRCGTAYLDIPKCLPRSAVYNESTNDMDVGYAQMLARYVPDNADMDINGSLYHTHSALFAPWQQYTYVGTNKKYPASPSFAALMIQRAMILNQSSQYEWALPDNRKHTLKFGKPDYTVPKKLLDVWQRLEGVGVNVISDIPEMGVSLWGNSTLYEVPPATYQALANLSTRLLVNAVENVIYKCGISITFKYNNNDAYSSFYAGVSPILDVMKNQGAIEDYYVKMSPDINGLDQVNANSVIGWVYLTVNGVINDIKVDLVALPPNVSLDQFKV